MNNGFLRVAVANPEIKIADPCANANAICDIVLAAQKRGVELLAFPELCITGYTCGDLFFQKTLIDGAEQALQTVAQKTKDCNTVLFLGLPVRISGKLYNACAVLHKGDILGITPKTYPRESELRCFTAWSGEESAVHFAEQITAFGRKTYCLHSEICVGVEIGEDLWASVPPSSRTGAVVTVNLAAIRESAGKAEERRMAVKSQSLRTASAYIYADAGRGESTTDEVYAGHGIIAENGVILAENKPFSDNTLTVADVDTDYLLYEHTRNNAVPPVKGSDIAFLDEEEYFCEWKGKIERVVPRLPFVPNSEEQAEEILTMQAEGLRKRLAHTGAKKLVLGVSGGLDSALALLVCLRTLDMLKRPHTDLVALSLPGFGTSKETAANALLLAKESKADHRIVDITPSVKQHLKDIGHDGKADTAYENAQARMRTVVLMDVANRESGIVVGTGDLSEVALGWCTYNGDHMSMYGVNASVPKTLVKYLVAYEAKRIGGKTAQALQGVLGTSISPELLPTQNGAIAQKTEEIIGTFEQNDFFLYYAVFKGCTPQKTLLYAATAFGGQPHDYAKDLAAFYKRFFAAQFKRSCSPDGASVGLSLSPRGAWRMPSDACVQQWLKDNA